MQKKIVFFIAIALLVTPVLAVAIRPAESASTTVLSQNFDNESTGSVPQGWTLGDPSICSLTVVDTVYHGSSGKSARYADLSSTAAAYVGRTFPDQDGTIVASFSIMEETPPYFMLYIDDGYSTHDGANIYFMPDGQLGYYDGSFHDMTPFSLNNWYQVEMVIDIPTNTYDIYINGLPTAQGVHFRGQATTLNTIEFGLNGVEMPTGYIDDISITSEQNTAPVATVTTLTGNLDYLLQEDAEVRLDALVKDLKNMTGVSNANVTLEIYYPNGSLWVSDVMQEKLNGTGIYEWTSNGTIDEMNLEKGVYLAYVQASIGGELPSTDILLFHVDPPSDSQPAPLMLELYDIGFAISLAAFTVVGAVLLRRYRRGITNASKASLTIK